MMVARKPDNEDQRLDALHAYRILDSESEPAFDALTRLASTICNTPISVVSLVDANRQWFKSALGLPGVSETSRDVAFCAHAILNRELMEIPDAQQDPRFHDNPLVENAPHIRFYAGMPLIDSNGFELGTLCVIDTQPKELSKEQRSALADLATTAVGLIQARTGESRFREIVDHAPYGIAVIDHEGRIQLPNDALLNMLGYGRQQLVGQPLKSLLRPATPDGTAASVHSHELPPGTALLALQASGRTIPVEATFRRLGGELTAVTLIDVSIRDAVAVNAEKAKAELQHIIDHMPAMIGYWDQSMCNRFGNQALREWFGVSSEGLHGQPLHRVLGSEPFEISLPLLHKVLEGEAQVFESPMADRKGKVRQVLASYVPDMRDGRVEGFYTFVHDISALREAEDARAAAEAQLQSVIDAASEFSIIATDMNGIITLFSRGSENMLGYLAKDMIGRYTPRILHLEEEIAAHGQVLEREFGVPVEGGDVLLHKVKAGAIDAGEWTYRRCDGTLLPVSLVLSGVRDAGGSLIGVLGVARDITEQKVYNATLAAARDAAEAASRAKSDFLANMSHEIRTPINAILGMTHLLENAPLNADRRRYTEMIRSAGQSLLDILSDILDFSKIEAGKMEIEPSPFALDEVLGAVATIMTVSAGNKDIELCLDVDPALPQTLVGERLRLQQVLINLVNNAIKFTEHGQVTLSMRMLHMDVHAVQVRFEIHDSGIGIDKEQQQKLFSAFTQADSSTTRRFGGTGLGLAISRSLVGLMGGKIGLESTPDQGSCFWFNVPLGLVTGDTAPHPAPACGPLSVLLADDHALTLASMQRLMQSWGWEVEGVDSASVAVTRLMECTQHTKPYDVVILDANLAGKAGFAALMNTRSDGHPGPAIILTRSGAGTEAGELEKNPWVSSILVKPLTTSRLVEAINDAISGTKTQAAPASTSFKKVPAALRLDGVHLLLVEDNPLNQIVGRGILEQAGAQVVIAIHGQQAVDVLRAQPTAFDLVLMDVQMPIMDGFKATRLIREQLGLKLPIIAMTAGVLASERDHCIAAGMNDFISKPINVQHMLSVLREHLSLNTPAVSTPIPLPLPAIDTGTEAEILDIGTLLNGMESNSDYVASIAQLLRQLCENGLSMADAVVVAWREGRTRDAMGLLHKMRGGVGTLGAMRLSALTILMEQTMSDGSREAVEAQLPQLQHEMSAVLDVARRWLQTNA